MITTASEPSWIAPFTGLSPRAFGKLVTVLRREGADAVRKGRPWSLPLEDQALLGAAYWRTNLTMRQLAPLFGVSSRRRTGSSTTSGRCSRSSHARGSPRTPCSIVDGTWVPTRDHTIAERSMNYRYSTNHQVVIDADTGLVGVVGRPLAGNRNDCKAWEESGAKAAVGKTTTIADGGYPGTGLVIPHRRERGQNELPDWKEEHNKSHKQVRARVEHVFARMKAWKILRDCRLEATKRSTTPCSASPGCTTLPSPDRPTGDTPCLGRLKDHLLDNPSQRGEFPCLRLLQPRPCRSGGFPVPVVVDALTEVLGAIEDGQSRQQGGVSSGSTRCSSAHRASSSCSPREVSALHASAHSSLHRTRKERQSKFSSAKTAILRCDSNTVLLHGSWISPDRPSVVPAILDPTALRRSLLPRAAERSVYGHACSFTTRSGLRQSAGPSADHANRTW